MGETVVESFDDMEQEDQDNKWKRLVIKILVIVVSLLLFLTIMIQPRFFTFLT